MNAAALFLALALASAGFAAIMRSTQKGDRASTPPHTRKLLSRWGGTLLIAVSVLPPAITGYGFAIGLAGWFFCVLPIAAMPAIFLSPFSPRATAALPVIFSMAALLAFSGTV